MFIDSKQHTSLRWKSVAAFATFFVVITLNAGGIIGIVPAFFSKSKIHLGADLIGGWVISLAPDPYDIVSIALDDINANFNNARDSHQARCSSIIKNRQLHISCSSEEDFRKISNRLSSLYNDLVSIEILDSSSLSIAPNDKMTSGILPEVLNRSMEVLMKRLDSNGRLGISIARGSKDLTISTSGLDEEELAKIRSLTQSTAKLTFKLLEASREKFGVSPDILSGSDLTRTVPNIDNRSGTASVICYFNASGAEKLAYITSNNIGETLSIALDGKVIQNAVIKGPIANGVAQISSSSMTIEDATNLAALFNSGALPSRLQITREEVYNPSQGKILTASSKKMIIGSFVGISFILIARYRLLGLLAIASMILHASLTITFLSALKCTLSFSGLAGLALSMGVSVDGSIIVFEGFRNRSYLSRSNISRIVENSFKTSIWSNFTTILALMSLFITNNPQLRGFAISTSIGLICSSLSNATINVVMIKKFSDFVSKITPCSSSNYIYD